MQLNLKNFSGVNENGKRYRVYMEEITDEIRPNYKVVFIAYKLFWPHCNIWLSDGKMACEAFGNKEDRLKALKKALEQIEEQTGLELIKREAVMLKTA